MNRLTAIVLLFLAVVGAVISQAPLPTPVAFAWDTPIGVESLDRLGLQWSTGSVDLNRSLTNYVVDNFPLGVAQPVSIYSVSTNGLISPSNTIYILNLRAIFEEFDSPAGPWRAGPEAHILVQRTVPLGFFRVRVEGN